MKPKKSYTIWFSQRVGSTLLCRALESTGIAGKPEEILRSPYTLDIMEHYKIRSYSKLQEFLWKKGMTLNRIFGLKVSYYRPHYEMMMKIFKNFPGAKNCLTRPEIWENAFPNGKHIFLTRRNKIRLAISSYRANKTDVWHIKKESKNKNPKNIKYSYQDIDRLLLMNVIKEAGIQEFFDEGNITPLTIVYEDFIKNYKKTVLEILEYLEIPISNKIIIKPLYLKKLADNISEEWVQRYREERQKDWDCISW